MDHCLSEQWGKEVHDIYIKKEQQQRSVWVNGPIIVGGGPSGLATAACLRERGVPCVILERADCIASLWQRRTYDRLKLHLPKHFCELPHMPFPQEFPTYPTKNQFIQYLESYADHFKLNPRFNERVESAWFDETCGLWRVKTVNSSTSGEEAEYICRWLIAATGENAEPVIPDINGVESFNGGIIHASTYQSGADFQGQNVLVVGCANSGMEVSLDLCDHNARPYMVVRSTVHVLPREMFGTSTFGVAMRLMKWFPVWLVDALLLLVAWWMFGSTDRYGIKRPSMGPLELKNKAGKSPVLDVGAVAKIKRGQIKVLPGIDYLTSHGAKFVNGQHMDFDSIILAMHVAEDVGRLWKEDTKQFTLYHSELRSDQNP